MDDTDSPNRGDLEYWLALTHTPGLGNARIARLLRESTGPRAIFEEPERLSASLNLGDSVRCWFKSPRWEIIEPALRWLDDPDHHIITLHDRRYPDLLSQTDAHPVLLFVHGNPELLRSTQLALVGSRNPSHSGRQTARRFARELASMGITVTSGMALGIDAAGHEGALDAAGSTIAVAGTGLDCVYPARHRDLARRIALRGALVSEFPPGTALARHNFPRRNRIISGLSMGTLVVEAARNSGSLITAREAVEQGREVFAVPGSIHNPLSRGCHRLIREGAKLVESIGDILEELGPQLGKLVQEPRPEEVDSQAAPRWDRQYRQLLSVLEFDPLPIDLIIGRCGLTADAVSSMLLMLELDGYVSSAPGGRYSRNAPGTNPVGNRHAVEVRPPPRPKVRK